MNTSSRFAFAVHVLALLAQQEGVPLSSEIIAGSVNTNPALIRRLLSMLANAGLTASQLGAGGGALLAREPQTITLLDVYRAVDDAQRAMEASLATRTLADVVADMARSERKLERTRARRA